MVTTDGKVDAHRLDDGTTMLRMIRALVDAWGTHPVCATSAGAVLNEFDMRVGDCREQRLHGCRWYALGGTEFVVLVGEGEGNKGS